MQIKDAYDILFQFQKELHSEYSTSFYINESSFQELYGSLEKKFITQQIQNKNYYSSIFFMNYFLEEKKLPFTNPNAMIQKNICKEEKSIPEIFTIEKEDGQHLLETLTKLDTNNALTPTLNNYITYCLIPSLYSMFLEANSFDLFCNLIEDLKNLHKNKEIAAPLHYIISRSLFVSPLFLIFIQKAIYTTLNHFCDGKLPLDYPDLLKNTIETAQNQILQSFKENMCFIPSYMLIFFKKVCDIKNFLIECLFKPMFENPAQFLVVDSIFTDFEYKIIDIQRFLQSVFTDEIIEKIAQLINDSKNSEKGLINQEYNENGILKITYKKIINSIDYDAFNLIHSFIEDMNNKSKHNEKNKEIDIFGSLSSSNYLLYQASFESEVNKSKQEIYLRTTIEKNDCWMYFRKILKESPPLLPNYHQSEEVVTKTSFLKMVEESLIDIDDPIKSIELNIAYTLFKKKFEKSNEEIILSKESFKNKMEKLDIKHTEQENTLTLLQKINFELDNLSLLIKDPIQLIQELYNTIITNNIHPPPDIKNRISNVRFISEILSDPLEIKSEFQKYLIIQGEQMKQIVGSMCPKICFYRFFHQLNFSKYCLYRTDLKKYDDIMRDVFQRYISIIKSKYINEIGQKSISDAISHISFFNNYFSQINEVFNNNSNPVKKLDEIGKVMDQLCSFFIREFFADGENDLTPFRIIAFAFSNPPRFVSNIVYILEYVYYDKNASRSVSTSESENKITTLVTILKQVFLDMNMQIFNKSIVYFLSRTHHRFIDIYITGSSSISIVSIFNFLIKLTNGKPLSIQELQKYAKSIESYSGKIITYKLNIENLVKENGYEHELFYYFVTKIHLGKNIRIMSNSKCDMKIGVYAYKYKNPTLEITGNYHNEIKNFVTSQDIDNDHKIVVHENDEIENHIERLNIPEEIKTVKCMDFSQSLSRLLNSV